jgi:hypothetical protein
MGRFTPWRKEPGNADTTTADSSRVEDENRPKKWNLGILSDPLTDEVPGTRTRVCRVWPGRLMRSRIRHSPFQSPQPQRAFGLATRSRKNIHLLAALGLRSSAKRLSRLSSVLPTILSFAAA